MISQPDRYVRGSRLHVAGLIVLGGLATLSCTSAHEAEERRMAATTRPALHGIQSEALRRAMHEFDRQSFEQQAIERYLGTPPAENLETVSSAAAAMAKTAIYIPQVLADTHLDESQRAAFIALASKLRDQADELQRIADRGNVEEARSAMRRITATCNACHSSFRWAKTTS